MITNSYFYTSVLQYPCEIHSLIKPSISTPTQFARDKTLFPTEKQIILYIHGTYATSHKFIEPMLQFHNIDPTIEIHALDLIGFGISNITDKYKEKKVASFTCEEIIEFYVHYIKKYIDITHLNKNKNLIIIGHSFGGFLSIHFANRYPYYLRKLVLVNPCGIFPMLGNYGNYWALFFKTNIMYYIYRIMKYIGFMQLFSKDNMAHIISKKNNYGYSFVGRFIYCGFGCQWKNICIDKIIHLCYDNPHIQLYFIYGEHDSIIPWQQGKILCDMLRKKCHYIIISNAYHVPYLENITEFCKKIFYIIQKNKFIPQEKKDITQKARLLKYILEKRCFGSYFPWITRKIIEYQNYLSYLIFKE